jgi:hypothetical protein
MQKRISEQSSPLSDGSDIPTGYTGLILVCTGHMSKLQRHLMAKG